MHFVEFMVRLNYINIILSLNLESHKCEKLYQQYYLEFVRMWLYFALQAVTWVLTLKLYEIHNDMDK